MLGWHNIWMTTARPRDGPGANRLGSAVRDGTRPLWALALAVGLAVLREGSEVVLFLYGIAATADGAGGIVAGRRARRSGRRIAAGAALYHGLVSIPLRHLFAVTGWMVLLLAAGMASQAAAFLVAGRPAAAARDQLWDTSFLLSERACRHACCTR